MFRAYTDLQGGHDMSDEKMIRKLSDDELQEVSGGNIIFRNTLYDKDEKAGINNALSDENTRGKINLLGTSSGGEKPSDRPIIQA